jgi:hypothetical protein
MPEMIVVRRETQYTRVAPAPTRIVLASGQQGPPGPTLSGGTAGQIIIKQSSTDGDIAWGTNAPAWVNLTGVPSTFTPSSHDHITVGGALDAAAINTGTLALARIPSLPASQVTSGTFDNARINWAAPSAIGSTTPVAGTFTALTLSTGLTLPDGSAGTPSINFTNNTNMGVYRFGSGEIGFSIGGNVQMQLNSVGLGLGTTAAVKLDLSSASATTIRVRTTTANNTQIHFIRTGTAEFAIGYNNSDTSFRIANNATVGTNDRVIISTAGAFTHNYTDAGTNNTVSTLILQRNSTGTPAANLAARILSQLHSSTTINQDASAIVTSWVTATHASRAARVTFNVYDTAIREAIRIEASGSAPMIGFLGANAVLRQGLGAWAGLTTDQKLDALRDALNNLGLASYS